MSSLAFLALACMVCIFSSVVAQTLTGTDTSATLTWSATVSGSTSYSLTAFMPSKYLWSVQLTFPGTLAISCSSAAGQTITKSPGNVYASNQICEGSSFSDNLCCAGGTLTLSLSRGFGRQQSPFSLSMTAQFPNNTYYTDAGLSQSLTAMDWVLMSLSECLSCNFSSQYFCAGLPFGCIANTTGCGVGSLKSLFTSPQQCQSAVSPIPAPWPTPSPLPASPSPPPPPPPPPPQANCAAQTTCQGCYAAAVQGGSCVWCTSLGCSDSIVTNAGCGTGPYYCGSLAPAVSNVGLVVGAVVGAVIAVIVLVVVIVCVYRRRVLQRQLQEKELATPFRELNSK